MMQGIYRVYKNGELLLEKENQMTVAGRAIVLKAIMGLVDTIGGRIQIGISNVPNGTSPNSILPDGLITDTRLGFAVDSIKTRLAFLDNSGNFDAMVFRGTLGPTRDAYKIHELAIFPNNPADGENNPASASTLVSGSSEDQWRNAGSLLGPVTGVYTNPSPPPATLGSAIDAPATSGYVNYFPTGFTGGFRVGSTALFLKQNQTLRIANFNNKFSSSGSNSFNPNDNISVAYSKVSDTAPTITLTFAFDNNSNFTTSFTAAAGHTYGIKDILQSAFTATGSMTQWSSVNSFSISSTSDVIIDAIRINDNFNTDTSFGMVSRTVLEDSQVITKGVAESLDIEYYLSFGFNKAV
jgi:hypothetical protein